MKRFLSALAAASLVASSVAIPATVRTLSAITVQDSARDGSARPAHGWTAERMERALAVAGDDTPAADAASTRPSPSPNDVLGAVWSGGGLVTRTVGRLFYVTDEDGAIVDNSCSANVVDSANGSVVMTAAHCAAGRDYVFVPGYDHGQAPFGIWTVDEIFSPEMPSLENDFAAFRMDHLDGRTIQDAVGAQRIAFSDPAPDRIWVFGYPRERANHPEDPWGGASLTYSEGTALPASFGQVGTGSDMSRGASGGPLFVDFDPLTGVGTQIAAVSGSRCLEFGDDWTCEVLEEVINGAPFGEVAKQLYEAASAPMHDASKTVG